jgi:hypothetical protein
MVTQDAMATTVGKGGPGWLLYGEPSAAAVRVPTSEVQSRGQGTGGW